MRLKTVALGGAVLSQGLVTAKTFPKAQNGLWAGVISNTTDIYSVRGKFEVPQVGKQANAQIAIGLDGFYCESKYFGPWRRDVVDRINNSISQMASSQALAGKREILRLRSITHTTSLPRRFFRPSSTHRKSSASRLATQSV